MRDNCKFRKGLQELNIELDERQFEQFEQYYDLLIEWNNVMNLTAITEYDEVIIKHFLDSLSIVKLNNVSRETLEKKDHKNRFIENKSEDNHEADSFKNESNKRTVIDFKGKKLLDLGTGAGFPGIPLKIAFPDLEIMLLDSLNKRIHFLDEVIAKLSLKNIQAIHGRAEELGRKEEFREKYDYCVSRAVARLVSLSEYCIPFVKKGGYFIPYKSGKAVEELEEANYAISQLGGKCEGQISFELPESGAERTLLLIKKCKETPNKFPRAGGKPLNKPLLVKN